MIHIEVLIYFWQLYLFYIYLICALKHLFKFKIIIKIFISANQVRLNDTFEFHSRKSSNIMNKITIDFFFSTAAFSIEFQIENTAIHITF